MNLLTIDVVVNFVGAKFRKLEKWQDVFPRVARASSPMNKWRPQLDSAHQTGLESTSHEPSDCSCDVSTGGQVCWGGIPKIGKVAGCFSQRSCNQQPWDKMEDTAGLGIVLPTLFE